MKTETNVIVEVRTLGSRVLVGLDGEVYALTALDADALVSMLKKASKQARAANKGDCR